MSSDLDFRAFAVTPDGRTLRLLDQRRLPTEERWLELRTIESVAEAIEGLAVRGAPAIGCAAALALAVASHDFPDEPSAFRAAFEKAVDRLARTRPTAVNLFVALDRMREVVARPGERSAEQLRRALFEGATRFVDEDRAACEAIGEHGKALVPRGARILTHCNTGALATAGWGTALGIIRSAHRAGLGVSVFADETRPLLQGARLTAWELVRSGIPVKVVTDGMACALMGRGLVDLVFVGADRITRNGDVANKIGTYSLAVACNHHGIPFYVAAPSTTIDFDLADGNLIELEQRSADEVRLHGDRLMTPPGVAVENPAFDVTPAALVTAIITERGVFAPARLEASR